MKKFISVQTIIEMVPLLAPLPTAWVVGSAMVTEMHWPWPLAVVGALIIEGLGFGTVDTALRMRDFNKSRRKRYDVNTKKTSYIDPAAPTFYAVIILIVYLAVAVTLTMLLDILPGMVTYARGVFPFLGALGAGLWALRADHERRVGEMQADKQEQREERRAAREAKLAANVGQSSRKGTKAWQQGNNTSRETSRKFTSTEDLLAFWREHPTASDGEVAKHFEVERQAIWQRRQRLITNGAIRWDGKSVEIVGTEEVEVAKVQEEMKEA